MPIQLELTGCYYLSLVFVKQISLQDWRGWLADTIIGFAFKSMAMCQSRVFDLQFLVLKGLACFACHLLRRVRE